MEITHPPYTQLNVIGVKDHPQTDKAAVNTGTNVNHPGLLIAMSLLYWLLKVTLSRSVRGTQLVGSSLVWLLIKHLRMVATFVSIFNFLFEREFTYNNFSQLCKDTDKDLPPPGLHRIALYKAAVTPEKIYFLSVLPRCGIEPSPITSHYTICLDTLAS